MNVPRPFGAGGGDRSDGAYDEFAPENEPEPGPFLAGQEVLTGREHAAVHRLARVLFEDRGVYDMTFGYNLARLNLDARHPDAGFRYARETDDPSVLRAEFTPTTEFCPQSDTLTLGAFRAWNGEADRHEYDLVRVRVSPMHHQNVAINGKLTQLEETVRERGELPPASGSGGGIDGADARSGTAGGGTGAGGPACGDGTTASRGGSVTDDVDATDHGLDDLDAPF